MGTWGDLERDSPELAAAGERLLFHPGFGFGYLATVAADGAPRIHPVMPILDGGRLVVFVVPSPKLRDLRRDGRFALHSSQTEHVNDELHVTGRAVVVAAPDRRASALARAAGTVGDDHVLVELDLHRALWAHYGEPPTWPPTYRVWAATSAG